MKKFLLSALFGSILLMSTPVAYGHGLGLDTIRSINVGDRKLNVTVQIIPTAFEESVEKKIIVTTSDAVTNLNLDDVTMSIGLYHDGNLIFEDYFFADDGKIVINVRPTESEPKIIADWNRDIGAWYAVESNPAELVGSVFATGGLYHFEIILESINNSEKGLANIGTFVADVTLTTSHFYDQKDWNGNTVEFGVKSYYDKISSFEYDSDAKTVTFEMPFDWTEQNISHVQVVHEEVHFPKEFEEFFAPSYVGKLNGIELFKSSITIDDYTSEDQRIVHFVLSQDNLRYLKQVQKSSGIENPQSMTFTLEPSDELVFPMVAMTKDESIQVDLSWDPRVIEPNKKTKFIYTFRDAKTGDLIRNTSYDFVILQNGKELYKKSANAQIGSDFADYTFTESQKGPTSIRFENIGGTGKQTEFVITVVPEFGQLALVVLSFAVAASLVGTRLRA
ncbi:MAG TPA: peptidase [Candidatus Nitrosotenuis sp.]|nr:peptidase [Candidatus Nitrosotenuis sp.]